MCFDFKSNYLTQRDIEKYLDLQAHPLREYGYHIHHNIHPSNSYIHPVMISPLSPSLITGVNWTGGVCMVQRVRQEKIAFP